MVLSSAARWVESCAADPYRRCGNDGSWLVQMVALKGGALLAMLPVSLHAPYHRGLLAPPCRLVNAHAVRVDSQGWCVLAVSLALAAVKTRDDQGARSAAIRQLHALATAAGQRMQPTAPLPSPPAQAWPCAALFRRP